MTTKPPHTRRAQNKAIIHILGDILDQSGTQIETMEQIVKEERDAALIELPNSNPQISRVQSFYKYMEEIDNDFEELCSVHESISLENAQQQLAQLEQEKLTARRNDEAKFRALQAQKTELEAIVQRHLETIDKLTGDKVTLTKRTEQLLCELQTREEKFRFGLQAVEHRHCEELRKCKDMATAAERARREDWINTERRKIKEVTLKAFEGELNAAGERHAQQMEALRLAHKDELEKRDVERTRKLEHRLQQQRQQLLDEYDAANAKERAEIEKDHAEMLAYEEQKRKEVEADWIGRNQKTEELWEERLRAAELEHKKAYDELVNKTLAVTTALDVCHARKVEKIQENMEIEMNFVKMECKRQMQKTIVEREMQIKRDATLERDREIEKVIEQFQAEVEQIKNNHECTIKSMEDESQLKINDLNDHLARANALQAKLENDIQDLNTRVKETEDNLDKAHETIKELNADRTRLERQRLELCKKHGDEVQNIHERVKKAIQLKDAKVRKLKDDNFILQDKIKFLSNAIRDTCK